MDACGCESFDEMFDSASAERDLARYRRGGPDATTAMLLDMLRAVGVRGASILDIGSGIGVIDHELLREGAGHAVLVDGSDASLTVARQVGRERNALDRMDFVDGDFVALAPGIDVADIVTLDRVVCCYPDADALVGTSAVRARSWYGLVLPRDRAFLRIGMRILNAWYRLRGRAYRGYTHPNARVDAVAAEAGLRPASERFTMVWRVVLYERAA
jgi:magnesium-protoporphyrin O-methyltransferase